MLYVYFLLSLCIIASCNGDGDWLKCKAKPGCSIARCDPTPRHLFENDKELNEYSILCEDNVSSRPDRSEMISLERKFEEMEKEMDRKMKNANERTERLKYEIEKLSSQYDGMKKENDVLKKKVDELSGMKRKGIERNHILMNFSKSSEDNCPVLFDNKCFVAFTERKTDYEEAVAECETLGGHLADIPNQSVMDSVMRYARKHHMGTSKHFQLRLGMRYENGTLLMRSGTEAPSDLKWFKGVKFKRGMFPNWSSVVLHVTTSPDSVFQHLINRPLTFKVYALCEIPWETPLTSTET